MNIHPLIEQAKKYGNPIINGNQATFIWIGKTAPRLIDDLHMWEDNPQKMSRIEKELWAYSIELPPATYLEYAMYDPRTRQRFQDPLNGNTVFNGFGHDNNFIYMPGHSPTTLAHRKKNVPHGKVTHHLVDAGILVDNSRRDVHFYHPPVSRPVPLIIIYDGKDYLERARLNVIVDNLIHEKRIQPVAMAFLYNGGEQRSVEYACSDAVTMWLDSVILPLARKNLNLLDLKKHPSTYGVVGASFGGLMSMYTGLRMPEIFGKVICQSGVFELEGRDFSAVDLIRSRHSREIKLWMDIGHFDFLLDDNRRMQPILKENGYDVTYREFSGGHNYTCWRDEIPLALEYQFG